MGRHRAHSGHVLSRCSAPIATERPASTPAAGSAPPHTCRRTASAESCELHLQMQSKYNKRVSTSTVGFAVADEDQERLARLVEHFGHGNRSAYLRATLPVMESLARAERLRELQGRNAERAATASQDYESLLADIRRAYKGGTPGQ
jgi:hypothetical protein